MDPALIEIRDTLYQGSWQSMLDDLQRKSADPKTSPKIKRVIGKDIPLIRAAIVNEKRSGKDKEGSPAPESPPVLDDLRRLVDELQERASDPSAPETVRGVVVRAVRDIRTALAKHR